VSVLRTSKRLVRTASCFDGPMTPFLQHVRGRKHRKFAADDSHYVELDALLDRVRRRTVEEVETMREGDVVIPAHCEEFGVLDTLHDLGTLEDDGFWGP